MDISTNHTEFVPAERDNSHLGVIEKTKEIIWKIIHRTDYLRFVTFASINDKNNRAMMHSKHNSIDVNIDKNGYEMFHRYRRLFVLDTAGFERYFVRNEMDSIMRKLI
jgi:hypothetical protein